ncbi:hypothetical protein B0H14DRAFT_2623254 [Mycena olivaceomarginata]|nr:hypothetical protein B0H14DRAFT_2623254 [Mycena olivaceomarginata]
MTYCNPLQYSGHRPSSQAPVRIFLYLALGAVSAYLTIYALNHNCQPSAKLDRLNDATTIVKGILAHVEGKHMRDYLVLAATKARFLRQGKTPCWSHYLHDMIAILHGLAMLECHCEVLIEAVHQHILTKDIC